MMSWSLMRREPLTLNMPLISNPIRCEYDLYLDGLSLVYTLEYDIMLENNCYEC